MRRHRVLIALWLATIAMFGLGFIVEPLLALLAQFCAFVLAIVTVRKAEPTGELRYVWVYRCALGLLLAAAGTVVVCGGSSVALGNSKDPVIGFIALATLNLFTAVLTWRALVNPAPRRAALVGLIAVVAELFALVVDIMLNLRHFEPTDFQIVAMFASFAATWTGALVCIAALATFAPSSMYSVPDARVVADR
jgi:hypothetical protein